MNIFDNRRNSYPSIEHSSKLKQTKTENVRTDSVVLQMSPSMRTNRKSMKAYQQNRLTPPSLDFDHLNNETSKATDNEYALRKDIIECLDESPSDFVHVTSFNSLIATQEFLKDLYTLQETVVVEIDVSSLGTISISYQKLVDFKFDFMMVDLSRKTNFMLFLKPF